MDRHFTSVSKIMNSLDEAGVQRLLDIAEKSSSGFDCVAKAAIHYQNLGNPANFGLLSKLILELEELEERNPRLGATESVLQRLAGPIGGAKSKEGLGIKLDEEQIRQHELRGLVVRRLFLEVAKKRPLKAVRYIFPSVRDPTTHDAAEGLFELLMKCGPWKVAQGSFNYFKSTIEGQVPLIYLAGPLLATTQEPSSKEECMRLLEKVLERKLGKGDPETTMLLMDVVTAVLSDPEEAGYAIRISEKMIDEGHVPLIYIAGPLLGSMNENNIRKSVSPLMIKITDYLADGRKLGNEGAGISSRTERIVRAACSNPTNEGIGVYLMKRMRRERLWNSQYEGPTWKRPAQKNNRHRKNSFHTKKKIR